jgi:hypothetical protein
MLNTWFIVSPCSRFTYGDTNLLLMDTCQRATSGTGKVRIDSLCGSLRGAVYTLLRHREDTLHKSTFSASSLLMLQRVATVIFIATATVRAIASPEVGSKEFVGKWQSDPNRSGFIPETTGALEITSEISSWTYLLRPAALTCHNAGTVPVEILEATSSEFSFAIDRSKGLLGCVAITVVCQVASKDTLDCAWPSGRRVPLSRLKEPGK